MKKVLASSRVIFIGGLLVSLVWPRFALGEDTGSGVQLMVELKTVSSTNSSSWLTSKYQSRILTSHAPQSYLASGKRVLARDLRSWRVIDIPASSLDQALGELSQDANVRVVTPAKIYQTAALPNDPQFSSQYGLSSSGGLGDIKASAAWDKTTGSASTVIAVIDGGVDINHEDLAGKVWQNQDETAGNNIDDDNNGFIDDVAGWDFVLDKAPTASIDHATHVAGIAAAASNNNIGVAGVDWQAKIMTVRALNQSGVGGEENIIKAIDYAAANGANIINMSIVGDDSPALLAAVENAYAKGVVVVAAAGNSGRDTGLTNPYPACAEPLGINMVVGVAATDEEGEPTSFSNYGKCIDVAAPGKNIFSTKAGDTYGKMTGTSMSSPFVAGAAGLYLATHSGAGPAETIAAIINSKDAFSGSKAADWNNRYKGKLNAAALVDSAGSSQNNAPDPTDAPSQQSSDEGSSGGGGGGGGGSDGGGDEQPAPTPRVAGATTSFKPSLTLLKQVDSAFKTVFGRLPNKPEHNYWYDRVKRGDKRTLTALVGAMNWQKANGRTYVPAAVKTKKQPLISIVDAIFSQVYGRKPTASEHKYWLGRVQRKEKKDEASLRGAILFHKISGIRH